MKLISKASMYYATRMLTAGQEFEASKNDARILTAIGKAEYAENRRRLLQTIRFPDPYQKVPEDPGPDLQISPDFQEEGEPSFEVDEVEDVG